MQGMIHVIPVAAAAVPANRVVRWLCLQNLTQIDHLQILPFVSFMFDVCWKN
jgi:hypothetical protein